MRAILSRSVAVLGPAYRSAASVPRFAGMLMGGALLGKALGFLRELEMARFFGASIVADSYRGALTAAWLPITPLQGDTVPTVLVPLHRKWRAEGRAATMSTAVTVALVLVAMVSTAGVWAFAGAWTTMMLGGFSPAAMRLARTFVAVLALGMPGSVLFNCTFSIEVSLKRSYAAALRAPLQNVGLIIGIGLAVVTGDPTYIAWGLVIAFTGIAVAATWMLWRDGHLTASADVLRCISPATREFLVRLRPVAILPLALQGNLWLERLLGSASAIGTLASVDYARTLSEIAVYALSQPLGMVVLGQPVDGQQAVSLLVRRIAGPLLTLLMPACALLAICAPDIVHVIFQRGLFQAHAVFLTVRALRGIAGGLWAGTVAAVLGRVLNSQGRNSQAALVFGAGFACNMLVNLVAVPAFGSLGIGIGEAVRGLVWLAGACLALQCTSIVLKEVLRALPLTGLVASLCWAVSRKPGGSVPRLAIVAAMYLLLVGTTLIMQSRTRRRLQQ